ncbi:hypothetical protein [Rhodococcus sp. OK302]|uniref:hypothetical protein n=1 Tax=Rhodococcus sp. OK302 TaxID=1882769 RepID=UPI00159591DF|nr:hypothetical protein [Rhodococcus sp. OK302]
MSSSDDDPASAATRITEILNIHSAHCHFSAYATDATTGHDTQLIEYPLVAQMHMVL